MQRDVLAVLEEIAGAVEVIREATADKSFEVFREARIARLAVERAIEIISEAARRLPDDLLARHPEIEWHKVKAIGNVLRHEYHRVSARIVWDAIQYELDALERAIESEIARLAPST